MTRRLQVFRRGITTLEVMVVSSLLVVILLGVVSITSYALQEWSRGGSRIGADNDASLALQKLSREIRDAIAGRVTTVNNVSRLTVDLPAVGADGDYNRYVVGETITYYVSGGNLVRYSDAGGVKTLARNVESAEFAVDGPVVRIVLTSREQVGTREAETELDTRVTLRNYVPTR